MCKNLNVYLFELKICYPTWICKTKKNFKAKTRKGAFSLARKWMENCLAICGKDGQGDKYIDAEIRCLNII